MKRNHSGNKLKVSFASLSRIKTASVLLFYCAFVALALEVDAQVLMRGFVGNCAVQSLLGQVWGVWGVFFLFFFLFSFRSSTSSGKMVR